MIDGDRVIVVAGEHAGRTGAIDDRDARMHDPPTFG